MKPSITIVGLGPGDSQYWTQAAAHLLNQADKIYVHIDQPTLSHLAADIHSFAAWNLPNQERVAAEIIRLGQQPDGLVFAVPGNPIIDQPIVSHIRALAKRAGLPVKIIPGLSLLESALVALEPASIEISTENLQIVDAALVASCYHPPLEPDRPVLLTNLSGESLIEPVKHTLLNAYPADFIVTLIQSPGAEKQHLLTCALAEVDKHVQPDKLTLIYLPPDTAHSGFSTFQNTIAHLRSPEGCPWDQKQTHQSLRPYLLEETYEVLETIDAGDPAALAEELGDLLLQIVLHAQIAIDQGEFKMGAVLDHINRKMLRRHPHVFGDVVVDNADEVKLNWEAIKQQEKSANGKTNPQQSALDGVPKALPALAAAMTISKKAARTGFEWTNIDGVIDKIIEEAQEVAEAADPAHLESEIGDLLFCIVNLARWRNVDPESALRSTNARFGRRFKGMEALAKSQNRSLSDLTLPEMAQLWNIAKAQEQEESL